MCNPCGNTELMHIHPYPRCHTRPASPHLLSWGGRRHKEKLKECLLSPWQHFTPGFPLWKPAGKAGPFNPIWHIRHLFGDVLKSFERLEYIFLQPYDSGRFVFSLKSSQCHNLHGKIKSCVCATELGECAEYSLCFCVSLWPFKTREGSFPTCYIVSDCQR